MYITGGTEIRVYVQKYFTDVADATAADDKFEVVTPGGTYFLIDEEGPDTALWSAAGVNFYTAANGEFFDLRSSDLTVGFPDDNNSSIFENVNSSTNIAGSAATFGEGAYGFSYNDDDFRVQLYIPTIIDAIEVAAKDVLDCQCNCNLNAAKAQYYIKLRAQLDLIMYKAQNATGFSNLAEINTMVTVLQNFVGGSEQLCGSC